jgi:hypothetical protein
VSVLTGDRCYAKLEPYLGAGLSLFAMSAQNMAHDMAIGNRRGAELDELLRQRVIEGSAEHNFDYWVRPPLLGVYLQEADEEMIDAVVYLSLWYMQRGRTL